MKEEQIRQIIREELSRTEGELMDKGNELEARLRDFIEEYRDFRRSAENLGFANFFDHGIDRRLLDAEEALIRVNQKIGGEFQ